MYRFVVNYWDDIDYKTRFESGICAEKTYGEAANAIIKFYGSDNIISIKLSELETILLDSNLVEELN